MSQEGTSNLSIRRTGIACSKIRERSYRAGEKRLQTARRNKIPTSHRSPPQTMLTIPSRGSKQGLHGARRSVQETNPGTSVRRANSPFYGLDRDPRLQDHQARPVGPDRETGHQLERYCRSGKAEKGNRRVDNLPRSKTGSLPSWLASRNTILRTPRLRKNATRCRHCERDQGDVLLCGRRVPNVKVAWRIRTKRLPTIHKGKGCV